MSICEPSHTNESIWFTTGDNVYLYRIAYEYPRTNQRARVTIAAEPHQVLELAQAVFCKPQRAYLLGIKELRKCEFNNELALT